MDTPFDYLAYTALLADVIENTALNDIESEQANVVAMKKTFSQLFLKVELYLTNPASEDFLEYFSKTYFDCLKGVSQLFLACKNPDTVTAPFNSEYVIAMRSQQLKQVRQLFDFLDGFYLELTQSNQFLPIPNPLDAIEQNNQDSGSSMKEISEQEISEEKIGEDAIHNGE